MLDAVKSQMVLPFSPSHSELRALVLRWFWTRMLSDAEGLILLPVPGCPVWHFLILSGHWYCFDFSLELVWPARFLLETQVCFS